VCHFGAIPKSKYSAGADLQSVPILQANKKGQWAMYHMADFKCEKFYLLSFRKLQNINHKKEWMFPFFFVS